MVSASHDIQLIIRIDRHANQLTIGGLEGEELLPAGGVGAYPPHKRRTLDAQQLVKRIVLVGKQKAVIIVLARGGIAPYQAYREDKSLFLQLPRIRT